jgi:hypothetical protein
MKILALIDYDQLVKVKIRDLQQLIDHGKITSFHRASGWVKVGCEPIRGCGGRDYPGPERREYQQTPSSGQDTSITVCSLTRDDWA